MVKPTLALIPAAQGDKLYSVLPSSGVGDFDFTRSGSATRINSQGLIETVSSGVSRLNYPMIDGVVKGCPHHILEPQRTNLIQYSEDFSNASWIKTRSSISGNSAISPNGTLNADKLIEDTSTNTHSTQNNVTIGNVDTTISVFVKADTRSRVRFILTDLTTGDYRIDLNLNNLSVIENNGGSRGSWANTSYKIENFTNNWYRVSLTATKGAGSQASLSINLLDNNGNHSYTGDGTSGVYIYGAMLEEGSYPTSYIPNYGTSGGVTRSAETATGSGDAATFNDSEGVLMSEISALATNSTGFTTISIEDGTLSNQVCFFYSSVSNEFKALIRQSGNKFFAVTTLTDSTDFIKVALLYKSGGSKLYINGSLIYSNTVSFSFTNPLSILKFGGSGLGNFYGKAKQIQYFNTSLTDQELKKLTTI